jgi:membrane protease YdiL (CAAX protease family)
MSYSPSHPSPAPPLSRASMVIGLYGGMALVALVIAAGRGEPDLYRVGAMAHWPLLAGPVAGVVVGLVVVGLTRVAARQSSSIGEELLFRGALLPWLGPWWQAVVFALLHVGPGKRFLPWTLSALVLGIGFGWLAVWTTNLGAPIAAHFTINFLNLRFISAEPAVLLRRPRPAA